MEEKIYKNLKLGNLYLCSYDEEGIIPQAIYPYLLSDGRSGNLHFFPSNIYLAKLCSKVIEEKLNKIKKHIDEWIKQGENKEYLTSPKIKTSKGRYSGTSLFNYLRVTGKTKESYDLIFNRFFIDNNQVNCILLCFQIEICGSESNKREDGIKDYPHTPHDGEGNKCYYNLDVDIHQPEDEIAKAFLKFVLEKEAEKA